MAGVDGRFDTLQEAIEAAIRGQGVTIAPLWEARIQSVVAEHGADYRFLDVMGATALRSALLTEDVVILVVVAKNGTVDGLYIWPKAE